MTIPTHDHGICEECGDHVSDCGCWEPEPNTARGSIPVRFQTRGEEHGGEEERAAMQLILSLTEDSARRLLAAIHDGDVDKVEIEAFTAVGADGSDRTPRLARDVANDVSAELLSVQMEPWLEGALSVRDWRALTMGRIDELERAQHDAQMRAEISREARS